MNLELTDEDASLVRYACTELASRRTEQAIDADRLEVSSACRVEAKAYHAIADRITRLLSDGPPKPAAH